MILMSLLQQALSKTTYLVMSLFAFVFVAASVNWVDGLYYAALGLLLIGLFCVSYNLGKMNRNRPLGHDERWMLATWLFYPAYAGLTIATRGEWSWIWFQESSRFLLIIPVFLTIRRYGLSQKVLRWSVVVGAVAAGLWAYYQKVMLGVARPAGGGNHIAAFGNIALLLGIMSVALWQPAWSKRPCWFVVPVVALLMGLFASFASGNKGGWISLPFLIWLAIGLLDKPTLKQKVLVVAALAGALVAVYFYSDSVRSRISVIFPAIYEYFANGVVYDGSAGVRLALWHGSFLVFIEHSLWGVGFGGYQDAVKPFIATGQVPPEAGTHGPHSQFFDSLTIFGWIGPLLIYGIYIRFMIFCQSFKERSKALSIAGLMLAVGYIDFGLVEYVWYRNNMGVFFVFMMAIIAGLLAHNTVCEMEKK